MAAATLISVEKVTVLLIGANYSRSTSIVEKQRKLPKIPLYTNTG